jgi:hypothetical protein
VAFLVALLPAGVCVAFGCLRAPLWLDEILYYYLQDDLVLRAAEIGRPASGIAPYFSNFFFCDLQRLVQATLGAIGLTIRREPEAVLRILPFASFVGACLVLYVAFRRSSGPLDALLGTLTFSSMPLVLYYGFEARVYAFTAFLVVVLLAALDRIPDRLSARHAATLAALGLVTAHTQLWTVCLFAVLAADAGLRLFVTRKAHSDVVARLAASLPALALIAAEYLYMRATDPGRPVYPPFLPQPVGFTLYELLVSNFSGPLHLQYVILHRHALGEALAFCGVALLGGLVVFAWRAGGSARRRAIGVALAALGLCAAVAVTLGYFQHARYHLPLLAALLFAVGPPRSSLARGLSAALLLVNVLLLPDVIEEADRKSDGRRLAGYVSWRFPDRAAGLIFQNVVTGGYQLPTYSIATDFYLNVLHPERPAVPLYEFPDLKRVNGRRGVYDLFAAGPEGLARIMKPMPEAWSRALEKAPPNLLLVHPIWGIPGSQQQVSALIGTLEASVTRRRTATFSLNGFPHLFAVEFTGAPPASTPPARP